MKSFKMRRERNDYIRVFLKPNILNSLVLALTLVLFVLTPYSILNAQLGRDSRIISVDATNGIQNSQLLSLPLNSMHIASAYLFPFMRDLISEPQDLSTYDRISLSASNTSNTSNTTNTSNNWTIISGNWQPVANGVQAGDNLYGLHNILVKPITVAPADLNTSFTINSLPPNTASYISIVYSWTDPQNYKYAGITLYNNQTYGHFGTVNDGQLTFDPPWPGPGIDLDLKTGQPIRMTLSLRDNSQELIVNGIEMSQENSGDTNESGYVGLSYGRVQDMVFHNLNMRDVNSP